ncbi:MAG: phosphatidylserine decarboxylase [Pirellulaceae bacterium]|nr:phosphatidylserine decarboxylase [Pirellulaceae bacterium]
MPDTLRRILVPIHREGRIFVAAFALVSLLAWLVWPWLGMIGAVLTIWCVYFFRDPVRVTPTRSGLVVSPADGVVETITLAKPPEELEMGDAQRTRISIFMNVFDVHVNRIPTDGVITKLSYRPGKFVNASLDKASEDNERQSVRLETSYGLELAFVQIAGLVARRILCELELDQDVKAGERFGMIRFGSRVDLFLPDDVAPLVCVGHRMVAGETIVADLTSKEPARTGEAR